VSGRRRLRTFAWPASTAVALALLVPAATRAQQRTVETATSGTVTAELSYTKRTRGRGEFRFEEFRDFRVKITRAGQLLYDRPVGDPCKQFCTPTESALTRKHIGLRDLNADGDPEVIAGLFTGGASCCVLVLAYGYDAAANTYRRAKLDTGGGFSARDLDHDGVTELVGDDFRFRGLFTCGACGPRPIRIWHYSLRRFQVVTTDFPREDPRARAPDAPFLRAGAQAQRGSLREGRAYAARGRPVPAGPLRPWLPDRAAAIRRGELDRRSLFDVSPLRFAYLRALKRFLRRIGYIA
jgi:hypothetical protein